VEDKCMDRGSILARKRYNEIKNKKLNDQVFYSLSTAIVILIVIVIRINHYD
jgi:hypothetical protein